MIRFYTVFWDNSNGVPDDKSFSQRKDAEAFYNGLNVPYKRLEVTTDNGDKMLMQTVTNEKRS